MHRSKIVVITGGPGTGKTSVVNLLKKKHHVVPESARLILTRNILFKGKNSEQVRGRKFQEAIWDLEVKHYKKIHNHNGQGYVFFDRGFFDGFAYARLSHLNGLHDRVVEGKHIKYDYVFILNPLPKKLYENDGVRSESYNEALKIHKLINQIYVRYGYKPIRVPFGTVKERTQYIINHLKKNKTS